MIIGPNGAGKTTVLDLICGTTKATAAAIKFKGQRADAMREHQIVQAGVGRKFQTPSIYENLTRVREPGDVVPARAQRVRGAGLHAHARGRASGSSEVAEVILLQDQLAERPRC